MKRARSIAADLAEKICFHFIPSLPCEYDLEHDPKSNDGHDYVLRLRKPHLPFKLAAQYTLSLAGIGSVALAPAALPFERSTLMDRVYYAYETHALALDEAAANVMAVYVQLDPLEGGELEWHVNLESNWMNAYFGGGAARFEPLGWFPPDVDPTAYGLKVDPRRIPQRTPLWFKLRGQVTGTKAATYTGFWVPSRAADPHWTPDAEKKFDPIQLANVRMGRRSELGGLCGYIAHRPRVRVSAVGWCDAPRPYPRGWGASPDALVCDPTMDWSAVPADIQKYFVNRLASFDPTRGVLEIKSSQRSLAFEPYFLPQVYMEMIATSTVWCDLMRYNPKLGLARIYRVYRHQPTEDLICNLVRHALTVPKDKLQTLLLEDQRYIEARDYIKSVAKTLSFVEIEVPSLEEEWRVYKAQRVSPPGSAGETTARVFPSPPEAGNGIDEPPILREELADNGEIRGAIKRVRQALDELEALFAP